MESDDSIDVATLDEQVDREMGWPSKPPRRSAGHWHALLGPVKQTSRIGQLLFKMLRSVAAIAFFPLFAPLSKHRQFDIDGNVTLVRRSWIWRVCDGLLMRVMLTPVILGIFCIVVVWLTTHPRHTHASNTPLSMNMVYRQVELTANDGQRLAAWYVPPVSTDDILASGAHVVDQKWPAAVLVHGLGHSHDQYLLLTRALNRAGFAVLLLDLRGQGDSAAATVTFGLRERLDVIAAVKYLRSLPAVDPARICLVGQGVGASAALHAAALDSSIKAVVAESVWPSFDTQVRSAFAHPTLPTRWLAPLYQVTFEMLLREHTQELNLQPLVRTLSHQAVLFMAYPTTDHTPIEQVLALAEATTGAHQVHIAQGGQRPGDLAEPIVAFLTAACKWESPRQRVDAQIKELFRSRAQ